LARVEESCSSAYLEMRTEGKVDGVPSSGSEQKAESSVLKIFTVEPWKPFTLNLNPYFLDMLSLSLLLTQALFTLLNPGSLQSRK
jgi:hypothetical protein